MTACPADMLLRPIEPPDADSFAALVRQAFAALQLEPPPSAATLTGEAVRAHLAACGGGVVGEGCCAGLLWAEKEGGLYVSRVAVQPAQRRQGWATRLLRAAEAEAVRRGLPRLWLSTRLALAGNRRLFAALGFRETSLHAHPGYFAPTFADMEKALPANQPGLPASSPR